MDFQEFKGKTVDDALTEALIALETTSDKVEYEVVEEGSSGLFGMFSKEAVVRVRKKMDTCDKLYAFLTEVLEKMGIDAEPKIEVNEEEKVYAINIEGEDTGDLIGKRGQTLDALQYLTSILANKESKEYYRVKLDTKNYRERRQKTLENLAKNVASKVKKTKHKVVLEPMNPYERGIIHSYLQSDKYVTTKSEGEEPNRKVIVYYKR